jgi:predicted GIY-YIG superfamily endonuclease
MSGKKKQLTEAEVRAKSVGLIAVITDSNFSVTTNNGIVVKCNPSDKKYKVYAIVSKVDGKLYVGYTAITLEKRALHRRNEIRTKIKRNEKLSPLQTDIVTHGSDNFFMFELCGFDNEKSATDHERRLIEEYKSHVTVGGYNGSSGGEGALSGAAREELEKASNAATLEIIHWILKHDGVMPNAASTDPEERRLGQKLASLRHACNNLDKTAFAWYPSNKELAVKHGLYWLFYSEEELANDDMNEIINWMLEHDGVPPKQNSKNPIEKKHGEKLEHFKQARNNPKSKSDCYNVEQIAIDRGFPHLLYSLEEHRNVGIREFADFFKEYNRKPKLSSKEEKELCQWWKGTKQRIKKGIKKKSDKYWTESNKKLAEELGVLEYFENSPSST